MLLSASSSISRSQSLPRIASQDRIAVATNRAVRQWIFCVLVAFAVASLLYLNLRTCNYTPAGASTDLLQSVTSMISSTPPPHYRLIVGVFSAIDHFELRKAWRECMIPPRWRGSHDVRILFIVGDKMCANHSITPFPNLDCNTNKSGAIVTDSPTLQRLHAEAQEHGDMVILDMVDVYRHLAQKLRLFYQWTERSWEDGTLRFDYTMKTDDDSWLNLDALMPSLERQPRRKLWLGKMKSDLTVARVGKSSEPDYASSKYPTFARGVGNVLSADLARWIGRNAEMLRDYQGEDVSAGIWLSAVKLEYKYDLKYHMFTCKDDMYSQPQVPLEKIRTYCANKARCNRICDCPANSTATAGRPGSKQDTTSGQLVHTPHVTFHTGMATKTASSPTTTTLGDSSIERTTT